MDNLDGQDLLVTAIAMQANVQDSYGETYDMDFVLRCKKTYDEHGGMIDIEHDFVDRTHIHVVDSYIQDEAWYLTTYIPYVSINQKIIEDIKKGALKGMSITAISDDDTDDFYDLLRKIKATKSSVLLQDLHDAKVPIVTFTANPALSSAVITEIVRLDNTQFYDDFLKNNKRDTNITSDTFKKNDTNNPSDTVKKVSKKQYSNRYNFKNYLQKICRLGNFLKSEEASKMQIAKKTKDTQDVSTVEDVDTSVNEQVVTDTITSDDVNDIITISKKDLVDYVDAAVAKALTQNIKNIDEDVEDDEATTDDEDLKTATKSKVITATPIAIDVPKNAIKRDCLGRRIN